jgi:cyanophycinase-like exopeptidase
MNGRIGLVGSGEFTPTTEDVDVTLLEQVDRRVVFLPTAAALEGTDRISYWVELGLAHYARLGVEASPLMVLDRASADNSELAAQVASAGLIYLSGGDPTYLATTIVGSRVGAAIVAAWRSGTSVAGCSAGAIALMEDVPDIRQGPGDAVAGLGLVPAMRVIPHLDRIERWMPGAVQRAIDRTPPGVQLVGIDEDTAVVGGPREWRVMGRGSAWLLSVPGAPLRYGDGAALALSGAPGG